MVGVPLSKGCLLCIKRRVRCGQEKPGCARCTKYGVVCPGYDRPLKFVAGKHHAQPRPKAPAAGRGNVVGDDSGTEVVDAAADSSSSRGLDDAHSLAADPPAGAVAVFLPSRAAIGREDGQGPDAQVLIALPAAVPPQALADNRAQFINTLLDSLRRSQPPGEIDFFKAWFLALPPHLGSKATVDSAVCALVLHMLGKATGDAGAVARSRSLYGRSLGALQLALNHQAEWKTAETLCSAMLLCYFELFAGTAHPSGWMAHARGVAKVMQLRGPAAYSSPWEKMMLHNFRAIITMNSMFSDEDCFLARREWRDLMCNLSAGIAPQHDGEGVGRRPEMDRLMDLYAYNLARVPSVIRRGEALRQAGMRGLPVDLRRLPALARDSAALLADFVTWRRHPVVRLVLRAPAEAVPQDPTSSPFATVLTFDNPWIGALHMGFQASVLILQECLNQCRGLVEVQPVAGGGRHDDQEEFFSPDNGVIARDIFRCIESVGRGVMGPFRCGYAMRVAFEFVTPEMRLWAVGVLARFETSYAATSPSTYPKPT